MQDRFAAFFGTCTEDRVDGEPSSPLGRQKKHKTFDLNELCKNAWVAKNKGRNIERRRIRGSKNPESIG